MAISTSRIAPAMTPWPAIPRTSLRGSERISDGQTEAVRAEGANVQHDCDAGQRDRLEVVRAAQLGGLAAERNGGDEQRGAHERREREEVAPRRRVQAHRRGGSDGEVQREPA